MSTPDRCLTWLWAVSLFLQLIENNAFPAVPTSDILEVRTWPVGERSGEPLRPSNMPVPSRDICQVSPTPLSETHHWRQEEGRKGSSARTPCFPAGPCSSEHVGNGVPVEPNLPGDTSGLEGRDQRQTLSRPQRAYRTRIMEGKAEEIVHLKKKINILSWISSSLKHCLPQDLTGSVTLIFVSMAPFQQLL